MLQVLPSYHTLAIPTCGLFMSSSVSPVPYSMACEAPWRFCCVIRRLYLFRASLIEILRTTRYILETPILKGGAATG